MAFSLRNLSVLAYANGFTLWHYKAESEDAGVVAAPGFFNPAGDMLAAGDMLMVSALHGARMLAVSPDQRGILTVPMG